ncbi:MAG: phage major capsid protein [Clostridiales bacterium]|nr:phage major capsid protein [Clostridiales bacterium]
MQNQTQTRAYNVRAAQKPLIVEGTAIVFDSPADMGGYTERITRDALDGVNLENIALLINHDGRGIPLAKSPKTLSLTVTETGLEMRAELPDTEQGRSVYEAVRRGDLSEMSFAFDIGAQAYDEQARERTITQIAAVYEISIVNRAAYPQTNVQARNAGKEHVMNNFNPIESAVLNAAQANPDTHATPEYRSAFFKKLLGRELTESENRAFTAAQAEKRADSFNTLSNSAAVIPTQTLNEVVKQARNINGLYNEVRIFNVPSNLSVPVGTPTDAASWHVEGTAVDRTNVTTTAVTFSGLELIKVISMSAAARRMDIAAFESYITQELRSSIADAIGAAIVEGSGEGQPVGILSGIDWTDDNTISTTALAADNLLSAIALLPAGYAGGAKFAMSTATLFGQVYPLKDNDGRYIFTDTESGSVRRLFGFPIVLDDNIPAGTVIFGNFRHYGVNIPQGVAVEVSRESGFTSGLIDFRALCIADGKPIVPGAFVKIEVTAA